LIFQIEESNIHIIDDFAHNPAEVAAAIRACQNIGEKVIAYFQPHGFGPLRFMHQELSEMVAETLRNEDIFLIGDVYYAGGTVDKDISPIIVSEAIVKEGKRAIFSGTKDESLSTILRFAEDDSIILIMGARDPHLDVFAKKVFTSLNLS